MATYIYISRTYQTAVRTLRIVSAGDRFLIRYLTNSSSEKLRRLPTPISELQAQYVYLIKVMYTSLIGFCR